MQFRNENPGFAKGDGPNLANRHRRLFFFVARHGAPNASGWSDSCRVEFTRTEDRRLLTANLGLQD